MVDAVNTVGTGSTVAVVAAQQSTASATTASTTAAKAPVAATPAVTAAQNYDYYAHRQFSDPSSGIFITEQLDTKGDITYQDPQGITLAYLRNGLTSGGLPKQIVTA